MAKRPKDFRWRCMETDCGAEGEADSPKAVQKGLLKHIKKEHGK